MELVNPKSHNPFFCRMLFSRKFLFVFSTTHFRGSFWYFCKINSDFTFGQTPSNRLFIFSHFWTVNQIFSNYEFWVQFQIFGGNKSKVFMTESKWFLSHPKAQIPDGLNQDRKNLKSRTRLDQKNFNLGLDRSRTNKFLKFSDQSGPIWTNLDHSAVHE